MQEIRFMKAKLYNLVFQKLSKDKEIAIKYHADYIYYIPYIYLIKNK